MDRGPGYRFDIRSFTGNFYWTILTARKERVNGTLSVVALELQDMVDNYDLSVRFDDGTSKEICDLNVNPQNEVSFRSRPPVYQWLNKKTV